MKNKIIFGIIFFLLCILNCVNSSSGSLRKVWLLTRHGDRSPTHNYPKLHQWEHLGELTGEGMNQLYRLGTHIRKKYIEELGFIPRNYSGPNTLYVRSTDKDRTLMSAQCLLFGLYPLGSGPGAALYGIPDDIPRPLNFQPIPIHSENTKNDYLLHGYKNCPPLKKLVSERKQTHAWREKEIETESFRESVAQRLGVASIPLSEISSVYHSLKAEMMHKHTNLIHFGFTDEDFHTIERLKNWVLARKYHTRKTGQIGTGVLLHHIVTQMNEVATNSSSTAVPNFTYYSAHDGTLLSLFSAMGFKPDNFDLPHYAAYIVFELHQHSGSFYVRVEYNGKPLSHLSKISLSDFKEQMKEGFSSEAEHKAFCQDGPYEAINSPNPVSTLLYYFGYLFVFILGYFLGNPHRPLKSKITKQN